MRWLTLILLLFSTLVLARDPAQVREFRKTHPCPATGKTSGACPGWVVDHIHSLCANGADAPANMIWQKKAESLEKDKAERAYCRWLRKLEARKAQEK